MQVFRSVSRNILMKIKSSLILVIITVFRHEEVQIKGMFISYIPSGHLNLHNFIGFINLL